MSRILRSFRGQRMLLSSTVRNIGTHVDQTTNLPGMVDIVEKKVTKRTAVAHTSVMLPPCVAREVRNSVSKTDTSSPFPNDLQSAKKGPVFSTAVVAGTSAVKNTHHMIPFCHPLPIEGCDFQLSFQEGMADHDLPSDWIRVDLTCRVSTTHKTGVEMEALTGASVAALTVYDMLKGIKGAQQEGLFIGPTKLEMKTGGKSDVNAS